MAENGKISQINCSIIAQALKELKRDDLASDVLLYMFGNLSLNDILVPKQEVNAAAVVKPSSKHLVRLNDLDVEFNFKPFKFQVNLFQTSKINNR